MVNWFDITARVFANSYTVASISNTVAHKYKGDFNGLLQREFNVPENQLIQHVIINGLDSGSDYDSSFTEIKLIKSEKLVPYL